MFSKYSIEILLKVGNFCANNLFDAFLHLQLAYCPLDYNTKSSAEDRELKYTRGRVFAQQCAVLCKMPHTAHKVFN